MACKYLVAKRPPGDGIELRGSISSQGVKESTLTSEVKKDSKDKGIANTGFSEESGDLYTEWVLKRMTQMVPLSCTLNVTG